MERYFINFLSRGFFVILVIMKDFYSLIKYVIIPVQFYTYFKTVPIVSPFSNFLSLFSSLSFCLCNFNSVDFPPFLLATSLLLKPQLQMSTKSLTSEEAKKSGLFTGGIFFLVLLCRSLQVRAMATGLASFYARSIILSSFIHSFCKEQNSRHFGYSSEQINRPCKVPA